ncbi:MAG: metalloregulator ArsR/SmtB family transcription factor [Xanthomonadales bacterium]|nr:metalloregulator ArsR/SmtB family transcription factor [Xanthomonadales bacterium]NIN59017.1 metalloregulator ArsR/SmtB family transcription factor [Xanthomonadales bacterium]NIN74947.1 metalloregulator ArsR/SmtB family transcription factor [Xanthomonadales bacterium]NIO13364.1 metalloregulator ArsR/SmtB family transcription factor [Xanthomonadales bacterium]NIP11410.1 metalloregulator ArsR/SmtB family transcription factor [Xanthomonadales bacterium]
MSLRGESIFRALADDRRRSILAMLRHHELPAGTVADRLGLSPATASHHLSILRQAGLVRARRDGRLRIYTLNASVVEEALILLTGLLRPAGEHDS